MLDAYEEEDPVNPDEVSDEYLSGIIAGEISNGLGHDDDEIEGNREDSMDYYLGRKPGDPGEGNSKVLSMDVADMTEATLSQILPCFSHDDLARFEYLNFHVLIQIRLHLVK